jgi:hypothetical protein
VLLAGSRRPAADAREAATDTLTSVAIELATDSP